MLPMQVWILGAARDFFPELTFRHSVCTPPCTIACIYICVCVKDPVVHVRVRWIMETLKHPACTLAWVEWLYCSWLSLPNFPWEKSHRDNTAVKSFYEKKRKKRSCWRWWSWRRDGLSQDWSFITVTSARNIVFSCCQALADLSMGKKKVMVPYRDSVLTKLLQNALGGNRWAVNSQFISLSGVKCKTTCSKGVETEGSSCLYVDS